MKVSYFAPPSHPPEREVAASIEWDLQTIRWCEEFGFSEYWMGEHFTDKWEPVPAPDLVLAQALTQTSTIKLGPAGHCLPYHNPAALAHRIAQLDHMAQGRYQFGVASGTIVSDWTLFGVDGASGQHREMTAEALEIILWLWSEDTVDGQFSGKYWTVTYPSAEFNEHQRGWLKPFQKPHPPIAVTGFTPYSGTLKMAGARGFIPMSLNLSTSFLGTHWEAISEGAASTGKTVHRQDWRVMKETFVAETDKEARRRTVDGPMGRMFREFLLPQFSSYGMLELLKHDPDLADSEVTVEYLADHSWLVGSPATVAEKLEQMYEDTGGFGHLMFYGHDYAQMPEAWRESLALFSGEVLPKVAHLTGKSAAAISETTASK